MSNLFNFFIIFWLGRWVIVTFIFIFITTELFWFHGIKILRFRFFNIMFILIIIHFVILFIIVNFILIIFIHFVILFIIANYFLAMLFILFCRIITITYNMMVLVFINIYIVIFKYFRVMTIWIIMFSFTVWIFSFSPCLRTITLFIFNFLVISVVIWLWIITNFFKFWMHKISANKCNEF